MCLQFSGLTFNDLLGTGVVDLLLGGVGRKHTIKRIGLPLKKQEPDPARQITHVH